MDKKKYIAMINYPDKHGHKATVYASGICEALKKITAEYGVGSNGIGCTIREDLED